MASTCWLLFCVATAVLLNTQTSEAHQALVPVPTDCSMIKYLYPTFKSGVYSIRPPGEEEFSAYCDMSESIGWTKILQIATPYVITRNGSGDIATGRCFSENAKMSDERINAIRVAREEVGEPGVVHYRVTARGVSDRVYMKAFKKEFNDLTAAWNIFAGARRQCFAVSLDVCNFKYFSTGHHTLDTIHDGSSSGQSRRFFTDHDGGNTQRRCWQIDSPKRCVSRGSPFDHISHSDVELWIGK